MPVHLNGCNADQVKQWLAWFDLSEGDHSMAQLLHHSVILPQIEEIVADFAGTLTRHERSSPLIQVADQASFRRAVKKGLLVLGLGFDTPAYFNRRLQLAHSFGTVGVPLRFYSASCYLLQKTLLDRIPVFIQEQVEIHHLLARFILKITSLDAALVSESHYFSRINHLKHSVDHLCQKVANYHQQAKTDPLTELANHGEILTELAEAMQVAGNRRASLCLLMIDIDFFKRVNDHHGHTIGDDVLRHVARRIQAAVRQLDRIGRYGGEEFLVILPDTAMDTGLTVAERIRCKVAERPIHTHGKDIEVTVSIGLAQYIAAENLYALVERADAAMYSAKKAGRNMVTVGLAPTR